MSVRRTHSLSTQIIVELRASGPRKKWVSAQIGSPTFLCSQKWVSATCLDLLLELCDRHAAPPCFWIRPTHTRMVATATVIVREAKHALSELSDDTYVRKLIAWANRYDSTATTQRPPKPPPPPCCSWRRAGDVAMLARLTAYTKAAALWRARHQHWRTVNSKRKAQRRAERDAQRDWAAAWRARKEPILEAHAAESNVARESEYNFDTGPSRLAELRRLAKHPHPLQPVAEPETTRYEPWKQLRRCRVCAFECVGIRYHCATCGNFDACHDCVARGVGLGTISVMLSPQPTEPSTK